MPDMSRTINGLGTMSLTGIDPRPMAHEVALTLRVDADDPTTAVATITAAAQELDRVHWAQSCAQPRKYAGMVHPTTRWVVIVASCRGYEDKHKLTGFVAHLLSDVIHATERHVQSPQPTRKKARKTTETATNHGKPPKYVNDKAVPFQAPIRARMNR